MSVCISVAKSFAWAEGRTDLHALTGQSFHVVKRAFSIHHDSALSSNRRIPAFFSECQPISQDDSSTQTDWEDVIRENGDCDHQAAPGSKGSFHQGRKGEGKQASQRAREGCTRPKASDSQGPPSCLPSHSGRDLELERQNNPSRRYVYI